MVILPRVSNMILPTHREMQAVTQKYGKPILTDFAIATGAKPQGLAYNPELGEFSQFGLAWEREMGAKTPAHQMVATYEALSEKQGNHLAGDQTIAVMPRIQNPKRLGFDTLELGGESVLTYQGKVTYYPHPATAADLSPWLYALLADGTKSQMFYTSIARAQTPDGNEPVRFQSNPCYAYQGRNYVYLGAAQPASALCEFNNGADCQDGEAYWFRTDPVRAVKCPNGDIQLRDMLAQCPFHYQAGFDRYFRGVEPHKLNNRQRLLNTDDFTVGHFMNYHLLHDLQLSIDLVDEKVNAQLAKQGLINAKLTTRKGGCFLKSGLKPSGPDFTPQITDSPRFDR